MSVYARPRSTADRLLEKFGAAVVLTRSTPGVYNDGTAIPGAAVVTTYTGTAIQEAYHIKDIDGTLILRGDVRFLIGPFQSNDADMPEPASNTDTVTFDGLTYVVISVEPINLSGEAVAFYIQARK